MPSHPTGEPSTAWPVWGAVLIRRDLAGGFSVVNPKSLICNGGKDDSCAGTTTATTRFSPQTPIACSRWLPESEEFAAMESGYAWRSIAVRRSGPQTVAKSGPPSGYFDDAEVCAVLHGEPANGDGGSGNFGPAIDLVKHPENPNRAPRRPVFVQRGIGINPVNGCGGWI
jgi:hypothetical protein